MIWGQTESAASAHDSIQNDSKEVTESFEEL